MNLFKRLLLACAVLAAGTATLSARPGGGGGLLYSLQRPDWNPAFLPEASGSGSIGQFGGYGYGVDREGFITGGFGLVMFDAGASYQAAAPASRVGGGFGGMIVGRRLSGGPLLNLDLAARLGVGGFRPGAATSYFSYYAEPYLELGVGLTPWMHLGVNVGYQLVGNLLPAAPGSAFGFHAPSLGFTLTWGRY
ncbi:MAG: hypothetical protein JNG85_14205 [Spirochaetaceae bacterium]|nr:hypothetical protein [Spirochaetaceae bacterium]